MLSDEKKQATIRMLHQVCEFVETVANDQDIIEFLSQHEYAISDRTAIVKDQILNKEPPTFSDKEIAFMLEEFLGSRLLAAAVAEYKKFGERNCQRIEKDLKDGVVTKEELQDMMEVLVRVKPKIN